MIMYVTYPQPNSEWYRICLIHRLKITLGNLFLKVTDYIMVSINICNMICLHIRSGVLQSKLVRTFTFLSHLPQLNHQSLSKIIKWLSFHCV